MGLQIKCLLELNCVCFVPLNSARAFVALGSRVVEGTKIRMPSRAATMDLMLTVVGVEPKERERVSPGAPVYNGHQVTPKGLLLFGETGSPVPYQNFYTLQLHLAITLFFSLLSFLYYSYLLCH